MAIFKKMQFDSAEMEQMYNEYIGSICERNRFFQKIKVQQSLTIARQALEYEKYNVGSFGVIRLIKYKVFVNIRCVLRRFLVA